MKECSPYQAIGRSCSIPLTGSALSQASAWPVGHRPLARLFQGTALCLVAGGGTPARFGEIQIWDLPAARLRRSVMLTGDTVFGVSISQDGSRVAAGCTRPTRYALSDTASGKEVPATMGAHENWVLGTVFGVDGKRVVSVGRDRSAKLTDAASGRLPGKT